jgi:L-amino acid N-acyltransferase YncA
VLRDAVPGDLPAIVAIYNSTIGTRLSTADTEPVSVESRRPWFDGHAAGSHPLWVLEGPTGAIDAWLSFQDFYGRPAYRATAEVSVYVDGARRGQGIGRTMLEAALAQAPSLGIRTLLGFIFGHNAASLRLFESLGFVSWGVLPAVATLDGVERDLVIVGKKV